LRQTETEGHLVAGRRGRRGRRDCGAGGVVAARRRRGSRPPARSKTALPTTRPPPRPRRSTDAFVWLRLYQHEVRYLVLRGRTRRCGGRCTARSGRWLTTPS